MIFVLSILAGLISSAIYHPIHIWPAIFIGLAILFKVNQSARLSQRIFLNYLFGVTYLLIPLYWVGNFVGWYAWIAVVLLQATFFVILSFGRGGISFATGWVVVEYVLRTYPFGGFGWNRIGFSLSESPLNFLYPRISIVGVAFVVAFASTLFARPKVKQTFGLLLSLILLALVPVNVVDTKNNSIALVQGGQEDEYENTSTNAISVLHNHLMLTSRISSKNLDLAIWPENAIWHDPIIRKSTNDALHNESKRLGVPLLVNGNLSDGTNSSVLIGSGQVQIYAKRYLTPFGEFIPHRFLVEKISDQASDVVGYTPGQISHLFTINSLSFRTLICYELLSDLQARKEMSDADFIVVQTNNSTFYKTWQLEQELSIAQARSAEASRYSAYVSTTGITAIIDNNGMIVSSLPKYESAVLVGELMSRSGVSPGTYTGQYIEILLIFTFLVQLAMQYRSGQLCKKTTRNISISKNS